MPAIVAFRFAFSTPWNWMLCRVVSRSVPLAYLPADVVHREVLVRGQLPAGQLEPDHEHVRLADAAFDAVLAGVAVLLLVAAVELDEALVRVAEVVERRVGELLGERAAEVAALGLVPLDRGELRLGRQSRRTSRDPGCRNVDVTR